VYHNLTVIYCGFKVMDTIGITKSEAAHPHTR
jgi:hypothetical protein